MVSWLSRLRARSTVLLADTGAVGKVSGLVTFLRTDIVGSTRLYRAPGLASHWIMDAHDRVLSSSILRHGGILDRCDGDSFFAVFARPTQAVAAAVDIQDSLDRQAWPPGLRPRVRMGIHTGEAGRLGPRGVDTRGLHANICGRLSAMAGADQILLTLYTAIFAAGEMPEGVTLRDHGPRVLRDVAEPQHVYELVRDTAPPAAPEDVDRRRLAVTISAVALLGAGSKLGAITGAVVRGSRRSVDRERVLIRAGLLPGRDFCRHALALSARGRVPGLGHLRACPVCTRRWRVTEAELQGWVPMAHDRAQAVLGRMAAIFTVPERDEPYRPFYAHLARCAACERELGRLTTPGEPQAVRPAGATRPDRPPPGTARHPVRWSPRPGGR